MESLIRVAVIDDHPLILHGFRGWIEEASGLVFAGAYLTVQEMLQGSTAHAVVLDLHLGDASRPADNVRALKLAGLVVLVVSADSESLSVIGAIEAGADGFLRKSDDLDALAVAIGEAMDGGQPISAELAFILSRDVRAERPKLTPREHEVLDYFGSGLTWDRVARKLDLSPQTVKVHLRNIRNKYTPHRA